jgi:hypothetical protein
LKHLTEEDKNPVELTKEQCLDFIQRFEDKQLVSMNKVFIMQIKGVAP